MEVFVSCPGLRFCPAEFPDGSVVRDVLTRFSQQQGLSSSSVVDLYVVRDGHLSHLEERLQPGVVYHLEPRLRGGKGGFGSMLRALGAQIEKTTNREACRDLSGRRLRDVNHEKEMAEWLKKQAEREAEKEQRRLERLQRKLSQPKHQFTDPEYQQQCHDLSERLEDSVIKGLQASSSAQVKVDDGTATKRPSAEQSEQPQKKKKTTTATATACFWTGVDELLSSEDEDDNGSPSTSSSSRGAAAVTMTMQEAEPGQSSRYRSGSVSRSVLGVLSGRASVSGFGRPEGGTDVSRFEVWGNAVGARRSPVLRQRTHTGSDRPGAARQTRKDQEEVKRSEGVSVDDGSQTCIVQSGSSMSADVCFYS
ncbi:Replication stress response regulator SDE2 [Larimichthys crocea]|uniref:Uncharacterized protein n=1 Tax=Larimichthys crocea TaxID=215358 RepID=A0ACD3RV52_LARCR|nr:Replication stress response regulator SDE2 [Larimichthys crocea]